MNREPVDAVEDVRCLVVDLSASEEERQDARLRSGIGSEPDNFMIVVCVGWLDSKSQFPDRCSQLARQLGE